MNTQNTRIEPILPAVNTEAGTLAICLNEFHRFYEEIREVHPEWGEDTEKAFRKHYGKAISQVTDLHVARAFPSFQIVGEDGDK